MNSIHQHVQGIGKLHGHAFHRCLACMVSKMSQDLPHTHNNYFDSKTYKQAIPTSPHPNANTTLKKGDHIHINFGFM